MNAKIAKTLMLDRKNSTIPKDPTVVTLTRRITAANTTIPTPMGIAGNQ
jgi:hypothetical protein